MLNLFFNNDGTTTISPTGKNIEISSVIKALLEEQCKYASSAQGKTYSIRKLPKEWAKKIVEYLSSLENVTVEEHSIDTVPIHKSYMITSKIGDKLTINVYQTGTLTLQGKLDTRKTVLDLFFGNGVALAMPFPRFVSRSTRTRGVFPQGHRICQSAVPYVRLKCPAYGRKLLSPCHSVRRVSVRPCRDTHAPC